MPSPDTRTGWPATAGHLFHGLAATLAIAGGAVFLAMSVMTVASIIGRNVFLMPIPGDFELVELGTSLGIFLALPYTQLNREHIVVDLLTGLMPHKVACTLNAAASLLFGVFMGILAWRLLHGAWNFIDSAQTTMLLSIPRWWSFVIIVPSVAIAAIACIVSFIEDIGRVAR